MRIFIINFSLQIKYFIFFLFESSCDKIIQLYL